MRLKNSTEHQVLLNILKGDIPSHLDDVNTDILYNLFQRHRLFPLASEIINLLDEKNREKWKNAIQVRTIKSLQLASNLKEVTGTFKAEGIESIPLKGPVLAQRLYGDIGSRHSVDLDLLVRAEQIERIIEIAKDLGYTLTFPNPGFSARRWNYYFRYKKEIGMHNRDQGIFLELHAGIDNHSLIRQSKEDLLWEGLSEQTVGDSHYLSMNEDHTFLYLTFHGGMHQFTRLFWLRDVAEALKRWSLDHQKILIKARSLGIERMLGMALVLAREYFNTGIPDDYHEYLKKDARAIRSLVQQCNYRILGPENPSFSARIRRQDYWLLLKPGLSHIWRLIKGLFHRWYIGKFLGGH